jgi:nucleoside-diphosphate-sugar epimerase
MPTTAYVAGATGYTGREVVRLLRARKVDVVAHLRPDSGRRGEWTRRWEQQGAAVDATPWEPEAIRQTLADRDPDLIFALLGTTRARAKREAKDGVPPDQNSYERVDYGMTKMLIDGLVANGSKGRFVYLSSEGVRPGGNAYIDVRWRIEQQLAQGPLAWTVARPSFITGSDREESRLGETIGASLTDPVLALVGALGGRRIRDRYRSTDATALAGALVHHALQPASAGRILRGEDLRGFGPG